MMMEQLRRENEWLKGLNEQNVKDKERAEQVEKALHLQFNELKEQITQLSQQIDKEKSQSQTISKQLTDNSSKNTKLE